MVVVVVKVNGVGCVDPGKMSVGWLMVVPTCNMSVSSSVGLSTGSCLTAASPG